MKIAFLLLASFPAFTQDLGKEGKLGKEMVLNKSYQNAIRHLDAGLEETPNNPVLFEYLGIAYLECISSLDGPSCAANAEKNMEAAIANNGRATFIADLATGKTNIIVRKQDELQVKRGLLHIDNKSLTFEPEHGGQTIEIAKADLKSTGMESKQVSTRNVFFVTTKSDRYRFRAADFSSEQSNLALKLIAQHLGVSGKSK